MGREQAFASDIRRGDHDVKMKKKNLYQCRKYRQGANDMNPPEEIFCSRCKSDQIKGPNEYYLDLDKCQEPRSYMRYRCGDCGCVFLVRDDHLSPGEQVERDIILAGLKEGKTPEVIAKGLGMSPKKVSMIVKRYEYDQR